MHALLIQLKRESENGESSASSATSPTDSPAHEESSGEPPMKKFHHLSRLLEEKWREGVKKASKQPAWEQQLQNYLSLVHQVKQQDDPIEFWTREEVLRDYPQVAVIAIDLLIIPGSSAPIERTFSTAGDASSGKRNRLADKNLEPQTCKF